MPADLTWRVGRKPCLLEKIVSLEITPILWLSIMCISVIMFCLLLMCLSVTAAMELNGAYKGKLTDGSETPPDKRRLVMGETYIGDNVWIGQNAVILMGSCIGSGCVIGANAVITKSIPPNSIVVGNNKIIRDYSLQL